MYLNSFRVTQNEKRNVSIATQSFRIFNKPNKISFQKRKQNKMKVKKEYNSSLPLIVPGLWNFKSLNLVKVKFKSKNSLVSSADNSENYVAFHRRKT